MVFVETIPGMLAQSARRFSGRTAIEDSDQEISFDVLHERAMRCSSALLGLGLQPGDRVAIWAPNIWEWIVAALGVHCAGGVLIPLNTRFKGAEAAFVLNKSRARILFTVQGFLGADYVNMLGRGDDTAPSDASLALPHLEEIVVMRGECGAGQLDWVSFLEKGSSVDPAQVRARVESVSGDDFSDFLFTSGTTGSPKAVMTTHEQNLRAFESWTEVVGLQEGDRYLIVNPFFHAFGYKAGWLSCLMRGATIVPHPVFDAGQVLQRLGRDRISVLPGPPALFQTILAHPDLERCDLSSLRLAVTGAAVIPVELIDRMRTRLGFETVITGYGLTEACGIATMCRFDDDLETIAKTSGRAIPDVEVQIVDEGGAEVPRGKPGEIVVCGYNVMKGYFEDETQTRAAIDGEGWLHTGDIGVMNDRGYIRITDRKKDMYIMGGFNCYPAEIERLMLLHEDFVQVAVIGVPDSRMGEVGMAFIVARPESHWAEDSVVDWCRDHMANYKVPRYVHMVTSLPMNATGKVQKFILRERASKATHDP